MHRYGPKLARIQTPTSFPDLADLFPLSSPSLPTLLHRLTNQSPPAFPTFSQTINALPISLICTDFAVMENCFRNLAVLCVLIEGTRSVSLVQLPSTYQTISALINPSFYI